jgi:peroxiredoxin
LKLETIFVSSDRLKSRPISSVSERLLADLYQRSGRPRDLGANLLSHHRGRTMAAILDPPGRPEGSSASRPTLGNRRPEKGVGRQWPLKVGDKAPDFGAETTQGRIRFHDWIVDSWAVLFSHPKDFTPVRTTELGYMAKIKPEFERRNVKIIGLSVDAVGNHAKWAADIEETQGHAPNYPIIGDGDYNVSKLYGASCEPFGRSARAHPSRQPDGTQRLRHTRTRRSSSYSPTR